MGTELSMKPTGWFQVGWSADIGTGQVVPLRYFGADLVAYRGLDGVLRIHDAQCQHLGASLAHGGCVVEGGIQCPFHGWVWGPDGRNVRIPYEERPHKARRVRPWQVAERNESVYLWHDTEGREPLWEVPDAFTGMGSHVAAREFHPSLPDGRIRMTGLRVHPQTLVENAVDPHHFRFVHGTEISPAVLEEVVAGPEWYARVGFGRRWASDPKRDPEARDTLNTLVIRWSGVGVSLNAEQLKEGIRVIAICGTPVDDEFTEIFATYWADRVEADAVPGNHERRIAQAKLALPDDVRIWHHQKYLEPPGLATSEAAGFRKLRRWAKQFYPEAQGSAEQAPVAAMRT
ncbi:Rieske 2Fe-2S domain-containing protein [Streptomyces sp. NPDC056660]|uniref:Rieske 2Fe-2S domain-containing protein n=1 Tax=Streptomyces sp. NPDC056660 TaxID=3345897 RepID=UPI0036743126